MVHLELTCRWVTATSSETKFRLCGKRFLSTKNLLQLQIEFFMWYSERSVVQSGADVTSMDHFCELRDAISTLVEKKTSCSSRTMSLPCAVRTATWSRRGSVEDSAVDDFVQALRDGNTALRDNLSGKKGLLQLQDDFLVLAL